MQQVAAVEDKSEAGGSQRKKAGGQPWGGQKKQCGEKKAWHDQTLYTMESAMDQPCRCHTPNPSKPENHTTRDCSWTRRLMNEGSEALPPPPPLTGANAQPVQAQPNRPQQQEGVHQVVEGNNASPHAPQGQNVYHDPNISYGIRHRLRRACGLWPHPEARLGSLDFVSDNDRSFANDTKFPRNDGVMLFGSHCVYLGTVPEPRYPSAVLVAPDPPRSAAARGLRSDRTASSVEVMMAGAADAGKGAAGDNNAPTRSTRQAKPVLEPDENIADTSNVPPVATPLQAAMNVLSMPDKGLTCQCLRIVDLWFLSADLARVAATRLRGRNLDKDLRREVHSGKSMSVSLSPAKKPKYSTPDKTLRAAQAAVEALESLSGDALVKQQARVKELLAMATKQTADIQEPVVRHQTVVIAEEKRRIQTVVALAQSSQLNLATLSNPLGGTTFKPPKETKDIVLDPAYPERTACIGAGLSEAYEIALVNFLRENRNIFAWSTDDLVGVPRELAEHSFNVWKDAKPVKQPLRRFAEDRRKIIGEEVTKLLLSGFIVEVLHTEWLANPVLVEKKKEEDPKAPKAWRMCIDYTHLNKARPKDSFPLARIDQVIDSTAGRFVSRLGEKALPLYALMKKLDTFIWTSQADAAFKELKKMLATAPILASPLRKEPMLLYIAATNRVVSAVVVVEREEEEKTMQRLVYYLSEVLSLSKQNCPHYQKMTYGVFMVATKLKHYFEEHPMTGVCEAPISEIIGNKDASARIAKWAIQLSPYVPLYKRRDD
ncbi:hypothetical protein QYE76_022519 [Lolium multiflorum]|uniref:Reverse transcriptase/retrotransposon-derived protein RNase H-like domain-containing protein n=1 Tax=Lolium multiflorum TaxID=4521 RepID=A0AAD8R9Q2_LOLMU|nr:hypothetical protein QYE76_022519 [Lolium multiflorum]